MSEGKTDTYSIEGDNAELRHYLARLARSSRCFSRCPHALAAGRESLHLSAVSEAIVHFERARQLVHEASLPETPDEADLRDLYMQLGRAYELGGQTEKALTIDAEREKFSFNLAL